MAKFAPFESISTRGALAAIGVMLATGIILILLGYRTDSMMLRILPIGAAFVIYGIVAQTQKPSDG